MSRLDDIGGRLYVSARAQIVSDPAELPREMAADHSELNPSFLWIAGRYVQAERLNRNGHFMTYDDLVAGQGSIQHSPLNGLHEWWKPIGTFVEAKIVERDGTHEIQALSAMWAANFPEMAAAIRQYHAEGNLWYSMECVAEARQCLTCDATFEWATAATDWCVHMAADPKAPRRFINPVFLGGALVYPPQQPAWADAEAEVASLIDSYAHRSEGPDLSDPLVWSLVMKMVSE